MLRLIDTKATHEFIPECERGKGNPTTFHVRAMTMRQAVKTAEAARPKADGGQAIPIDAIIELLTANIERIENGAPSGSVADFIDGCSAPETIGVLFDVFKFIQGLSTPNEAELGN